MFLPSCVQFSITQKVPGLKEKNLSKLLVITKSKSKNKISPSRSNKGYCQMLSFLQGVTDISLGILIFSSGLCILGESIIQKINDGNWFLIGTIALVFVNTGLCLMINAKNYR